jgi:hypothetical protein
MSTNIKRPVITYENVAVFKSNVSNISTEEQKNSGQNLSFLPFVQGISFSFDISRTNVAALSTDNFVDKSNRLSPDVNFSIDTLEDFGELFKTLLEAKQLNINRLEKDFNFYAFIGEKSKFDISGSSLNGLELLSFGNCFLTDVSISQSINGLISSQYSYVGSNLEAQVTSNDLNNAKFKIPSINLSTNQPQDLSGSFLGMSSYYTGDAKKIIPHNKTNILISGANSFNNFLIKSDSIQNFDFNIPVNRKSIYDLGKTYPVKRKILNPILSTLSFSNIVSNFETTGDMSSLSDFLKTDEFYKLILSGEKNNSESFNFSIQSGKFDSINYSTDIGGNTIANLTFSFNVNTFQITDAVLPQKPSLLQQNSFHLLQQNSDFINL